MQIQLHEKSERVKLKRGVSQGANLSPKLFKLVLEDALKKIKWNARGINVAGEYLHHLKFADDILQSLPSQEKN